MSRIVIEIDLTDDTTTGDLTAVQGAIFNAATGYVDWEGLHHQDPDAISRPGIILFQIAKQIGCSTRTVSDAIANLEHENLLIVVRKKRGGNSYFIRMPYEQK